MGLFHRLEVQALFEPGSLSDYICLLHHFECLEYQWCIVCHIRDLVVSAVAILL